MRIACFLLLLLCVLLCATPLVARAQESGSAQTVPRGTVQIEGGVSFARAESERETALGGVQVRVGLDPKTEVRVGVPSYIFLRGGARAAGLGDSYIGIKRTLFGDQKAQLAPVAGNEGQTQAQAQTQQQAQTQAEAQRERNGRGRTKRAGAAGAQQADLPKPALGLVVGTTLPTGANVTGSGRFEPQALLAFEASLSPRVALASNLGYTSVVGQNQRFGQVFGSLALGYSVNDKLGYFGEVFGTRDTGAGRQNQAFLNVGAVYVVNDNFELDGGIAPSITDDPTRNYQLGLSFTRRF